MRQFNESMSPPCRVALPLLVAGLGCNAFAQPVVIVSSTRTVSASTSGTSGQPASQMFIAPGSGPFNQTAVAMTNGIGYAMASASQDSSFSPLGLSATTTARSEARSTQAGAIADAVGRSEFRVTFDVTRASLVGFSSSHTACIATPHSCCVPLARSLVELRREGGGLVYWSEFGVPASPQCGQVIIDALGPLPAGRYEILVVAETNIHATSQPSVPLEALAEGYFSGFGCYANCDRSTTPPVLNVSDFVCFNTVFAANSWVANCDLSTTPPYLNVNDFICFMNAYGAGCP